MSAPGLVGLMGWPVSHSRSPALHQAGFMALGLPWRYVLLPVSPDRLCEAVGGLRALGFRGANVTVPHKQAVLPFLDQLTPRAARLEAVNTIWIDDDQLWGDNTDLPGFLTDLRDHDVNLAGRRALVLGAGGAARAVVEGLVEAGCTELTVLNRTPDRAEELIGRLESRAFGCKLTAGEFPQGIRRHAASADLIVNCTTVGMQPDQLAWLPDVSFTAEQVVYDLIYAPEHTPLLSRATADGARALGGLGMLIRQGALAFERWTGQAAPVDAMRRALQEGIPC